MSLKMNTDALKSELDSVESQIKELEIRWEDNDRKSLNNSGVSNSLGHLFERKKDILLELEEREKQEKKSTVMPVTKTIYKETPVKQLVMPLDELLTPIKK